MSTTIESRTKKFPLGIVASLFGLCLLMPTLCVFVSREIRASSVFTDSGNLVLAGLELALLILQPFWAVHALRKFVRSRIGLMILEEISRVRWSGADSISAK